MRDLSVLLVQACVGLLVLFAMAASALTQSSGYVPPAGILQIVVLGTFVKRHLGEVAGLEWLGKALLGDDASLPLGISERTRRLLACYSQFHERGVVAESQLLPWNLKHEPFSHWVGASILGVVALALAPLLGLFSLRIHEREAGVPTTPLIAPAERAYRLIQVVGLLAAVCLWCAVIVYVCDGRVRIALLLALAVPALALIASFVRIASAQKRWKTFWSARLAEVAQHATAKDDHDLFLRASYFSDSVKREAVIPLTDAQRAVLMVTAIVQLLLLGIVPLVKSLWQHHPFTAP